MSVDTVARSRRAVLMGALGATAATVASAFGRPAPARAGVDGDVVLGASNSAGATTSITASPNTDPAFLATSQQSNGLGLKGVSPGIGVMGEADFRAVYGTSDAGTGIYGESETGRGADAVSQQTGARGNSTWTAPTEDFEVQSHRTGVLGIAGYEGDIPTNTDETGVFGFCNLSPISTGVWGDSGQGYGVFGSGDVGVGGSGFIGVEANPVGAGSMGLFTRATSGEAGVYAYAGTGTPPAPIPNVAVQARAGSTSQVALNVNGKAQFSRSGRTTISTGASKKVVTMAGVTTASYVIATLQTNRAGTYVQSVVPAAGSFTINLNKTVPGATVVGYLVIN